jgi:AAT family amino acid transporter
MSSEATAAALLLRSWIPQFSLASLAVAIVIGVILLNLVGAAVFSRLETSLASIKLAALVVFLGLAAALIFGVFPHRAPVGLGVLRTAAFFPGGVGGIAGSMLLVMFAYAGFEVIGLAASETGDPQRTVPRAILYTTVSLVGLYILVVAALLPLVPTGGLNTTVSPLVAALGARGLGVAAGTVNVILVTAIISTMLAATFGLGRMVRSLAGAGHAPAILLDRGEVPVRGILFSGLAMLAGVSLAFLLPKRVYIFLVSSGGFSLLFVYLVILLCHYRFRRRLGCPPRGHCQLAGFPYTSWIGIAGLVVIIVTMPLIPGQGAGLAAGLSLVVLYALCYLMLFRLPQAARSPAAPAAKPLKARRDEQNTERPDKD